MNNRTAWLPAAIIVVSFTIMAIVTEQVVLASIDLVKQLPISASFFGVVFLGVVTSLPEFTTALVSMYKGKRDISVGVLLGSNVTNPLLGIGLGALLSTYTVPNVIILYDLPVNIVTTVLLYGFLIRHKDLSRTEAIILFAFFFTYLYVRLILFPADFPELGR